MSASQATKKHLAEGYKPSTRIVEMIAVMVFFVAEAFLLSRVVMDLVPHPLIVLPAFLLGYLGADFVSGFVHWFGDTWGTPETPFIGATFIRPFREHHVDQTAITRHDFFQTNGSNCLASAAVLLPTIFILLALPRTELVIFLLSFILALTLSVFGTNQFHKWAHQTHPPRFVAWLQEKRLVLSSSHHAIHHTYPHDRYYCITVGWLNPWLERIRFFPRLERLITHYTGAIPRQDDMTLVNE